MLPPAGRYTLNWFPVRVWLGQAEKGCCSVTWHTQTLLRVTWLIWRLLAPGRAQHSVCRRVLRPGNHLAALRWTCLHRDSCVCRVYSSPSLAPKDAMMRWSSPHLSSTIYITKRCASKDRINNKGGTDCSLPSSPF